MVFVFIFISKDCIWALTASYPRTPLRSRNREGSSGCGPQGLVRANRLRRGPQDAPRDIQVPLAPSGSRRLIPFAATVLRSLALLCYRSRASSHNDFTPLTRLSRALRLRFAFPGSS
jgi:hypothetical protein